MRRRRGGEGDDGRRREHDGSELSCVHGVAPLSVAFWLGDAVDVNAYTHQLQRPFVAGWNRGPGATQSSGRR